MEPLDPGPRPHLDSFATCNRPEEALMQTVVVFTPCPILTVTIEMRSDGGDELHVHAGGQGVWISRMLARLGVRPLLCAPFGGETGSVLRHRAEQEGIAVDGVTVQEASGFYLHDRRSGARRVLASREGGRLDRHEADDLYDAALVAGLDARFVVLAGQHPPGAIPMEMYRRLAGDLRANGCQVIGDLSGEALTEALQGGLDVLKISDEEATADGWVRGPHRDDLLLGIERLQEAGARTVIMSCAGDPVIAGSGRQLWEIEVPRLEPVDTRGTGDSMTAGLAAGLANGLEARQILRLAAAAGSLNATRRGLGTGGRREIERLARHVELRDVAPPSAASEDWGREPTSR